MDGTTNTQVEVEKPTKQIAKESYEAGYAKAKRELEAQQQNADVEAKIKRLDELEKAEAERLAQAEINETINNLKDDELKEAGLKTAGIKRFATENIDSIKGLKGTELSAKIKEIRESVNEDDQTLFFENVEVNASGSIVASAKSDQEEAGKVEYYPGTSIIKR